MLHFWLSQSKALGIINVVGLFLGNEEVFDEKVSCDGCLYSGQTLYG